MTKETSQKDGVEHSQCENDAKVYHASFESPKFGACHLIKGRVEIKMQQNVCKFLFSSELCTGLKAGYDKIPLAQYTCSCDSGEIKSIQHGLFYCNFYKDLQKDIITPLILSVPKRTAHFYVQRIKLWSHLYAYREVINMINQEFVLTALHRNIEYFIYLLKLSYILDLCEAALICLDDILHATEISQGGQTTTAKHQTVVFRDTM
ncbi:hypothetical protein L345_12591, partial [Ophiophagus hannah]